MDRLQTMQIYVQVVDSGSFTQAAEVLQLHRPTITKAVQQLERELGVRLLHRTTRKVSVTAEGGEFYQRCRRLLEEVNDTFNSFTSHAVVPTGRLRLDLPVTLAKSVIIPALPDFQKRYPQIELILGATDQPVDLFDDGIDCVVRLGELKDSSLVARRIGAIPMVTCASPQYLERYGMPTSLEDLDQQLEQAKSFVNAGLASGKLHPVIDRTFAFEEIAEAHRHMEANAQVGKIVVTL